MGRERTGRFEGVQNQTGYFAEQIAESIARECVRATRQIAFAVTDVRMVMGPLEFANLVTEAPSTEGMMVPRGRRAV